MGSGCCTPYVFESYFHGDESSSPFLKPSARGFGGDLRLSAAISSGILLALSFALSFTAQWQPVGHMLLVIVYFLAGVPSLIESFEDLLNLDINIDVLMTLAAFSSVLMGSGLEGALLLVLFEISGALEESVSHKAKGALASLQSLSPTRCLVVQADGSLTERSIRDTEVGTTILVRSGQVVPLDGKVIEGSSSVNLVHLTGENLPVPKTVDDEVPAGAKNLEGSLTLTVLRSSADSTLTQIIKLVTEAQEARPMLQRWFDRLSRRYALSIIGFAALLSAGLPFLIQIPYFGVEGSIYRALTFLIAASPCALIIALPIAYLSAVSACARQGVLLKGGVTLDALANCKILAFDKTGTLTTGQLALTDLEVLVGDLQPDQILSVSLALERNAVHPIAAAIVAHCQNNGIKAAPIRDFRAVPGQGLEGIDEQGHALYIGRPDFIADTLSPDLSDTLRRRSRQVEESGELLAILRIGEGLALLRFRDTPRPNAAAALEQLRSESRMRLLMLTGDHQNSAQSIAAEIGIDEFYANLRPEDKLHHVSALSEEEGLAMIGDGVNDAPALARATVGISMGQVGSSTAIDASDVVLLHDDLDTLPWLLRKAHQTQRIVRENLTIAFGAMGVAVTAALLGEIPLWMAVVMHEGGTVLVGLNALRLLRT